MDFIANISHESNISKIETNRNILRKYIWLISFYFKYLGKTWKHYRKFYSYFVVVCLNAHVVWKLWWWCTVGGYVIWIELLGIVIDIVLCVSAPADLVICFVNGTTASLTTNRTLLIFFSLCFITRLCKILLNFFHDQYEKFTQRYPFIRKCQYISFQRIFFRSIRHDHIFYYIPTEVGSLTPELYYYSRIT